MSKPAEDETSDRKTSHRHNYPHVGQKQTGLGLAASEATRHREQDAASTDPIPWGCLRLVDKPDVSLAYPREGFPASKPQGYTVGRDSECGGSSRVLS